MAALFVKFVNLNPGPSHSRKQDPVRSQATHQEDELKARTTPPTAPRGYDPELVPNLERALRQVEVAERSGRQILQEPLTRRMLERGLSEVQAKSELMREEHGCDCPVCLIFVKGPTLDDSDGESEVGDRDDVDMESGSRWKAHKAANAREQVPLVAAKKSAPIASAAFGY